MAETLVLVLERVMSDDEASASGRSAATTSAGPPISRALWRTRRAGPRFVTHDQQSLRAAVAS
jgi:hypothetical protein